jgi:hypothetical protein
MKINLLWLFILLAGVSGSIAAQGLVAGQLLKSNGKPLGYTEIELVPLGAKRLVNDPRLIGISGADGRFAMTKVPRGKYTLSINFDDKPTALSPYDTFYYPNTYNRAEAELFDVSDGVRHQKLVFKLPPALAQKKITGKVVFADGRPVGGAFLALRDLKFDRGIFFGQYKTDRLGNFSFNAFADRRYQVAAMLVERLGATAFDPYEFRGAAESEVFLLETLPVNLRLTLREYQDYDQIREKYMGRLAPAYSIDVFDASSKGE